MFWDPIYDPQTGNSPVTSYSLEYDGGTEGLAWTPVTGYLSDFTVLSTTVTNNIVRGMTY